MRFNLYIRIFIFLRQLDFQVLLRILSFYLFILLLTRSFMLI